MHITRRAVVGSALGVAGIAALGVTAASAPWSRPSATTAAGPTIVTLSRSRFAPHVGLPFTATIGDTSHALVLSRIDDLPPQHGTDDEQRFNLIFSEQGEALPDGIYEVAREGSAPADLFLSAIGADGDRQLQGLVDQSV